MQSTGNEWFESCHSILAAYKPPFCFLILGKLVQKILFWLKPEFSVNFQSGGKQRFKNPLPSRGTLKENGSSVIRDVNPGL